MGFLASARRSYWPVPFSIRPKGAIVKAYFCGVYPAAKNRPPGCGDASGRAGRAGEERGLVSAEGRDVDGHAGAGRAVGVVRSALNVRLVRRRAAGGDGRDAQPLDVAVGHQEVGGVRVAAGGVQGVVTGPGRIARVARVELTAVAVRVRAAGVSTLLCVSSLLSREF